MKDLIVWTPPKFTSGWMLWYANRPLIENLRMWRGHLVRVAGFERLGGRGCVCGWWEPRGRHWPGWFWRRYWRSHHDRYECDGSDIYTNED